MIINNLPLSQIDWVLEPLIFIGRCYKRPSAGIKRILYFSFCFVFCSVAALGTPGVRVPVEAMEKMSTHIVIIAPEKFTTESVFSNYVVRYKYSEIKYLKGEGLGSDLLIYNYPEEYGKILTNAFTGNHLDSLPDGTKKEECIDILFLYKDIITGRLYWIPFNGPNCFPLRKYLDKINCLQDLISIAEETKEPCLISFIALITYRSADFSWRRRVDDLAKTLDGEAKKLLMDSLASSPVKREIVSLDSLVPDIHIKEMKALEDKVKIVLSGFMSAVLSSKISDALAFTAGEGRAVAMDSMDMKKFLESKTVKQIQSLGAFNGIDITNIQQAGSFIEVSGTINGNNGAARFTSSLSKDKMKITSLDFDSKNP
jgi:hypothetical protein